MLSDQYHRNSGYLSSEDGLLKTFLTEHKERKTEESLIDPKPTETEPLSPSPHPEGSPREEEEGGYSTPELPTGQELVLNLLTTWGDQFYIGLTGLEIFTASGERACIDQVHSNSVATQMKERPLGMQHDILVPCLNHF